MTCAWLLHLVIRLHVFSLSGTKIGMK